MKVNSILGVIPARGGSKGLPRKNILPLNGKPLIAWTIEAAQKSGCFDQLIVTTDDEEIAAVAKEYGASVPFMRPSELATDTATNIDVLLHTMSHSGKTQDLVMYLQPTSPLRTPADIVESIEYLFAKNAQAVVSVTPAEHPPSYSNHLPPNGSLVNFIDPAVVRNRQELGAYYRLNGAIFLGRWAHLIKQRSWFDCWFREESYAYIMPQERSIDIDSTLDLFLAEALLKNSSPS